ncbi:MAG: SDR family oxidoreductase [Pseudomonadota bacterium]
MKNFDNKNVYLVGGSSGIGLCVGQAAARRGANVIIFARGRERLEKARREIAAAAGTAQRKYECRVLDASDIRNVREVMAEAVQAFGPPDVLVNCAGRALPHYFEDITHEQFDETMKINLYSAWNTISVLLPDLKRTRGCVVNVSSIAGFIGVFGYTDYSASKFAVIGFSESLRAELRKHGVQVAVLCPPDTDTPAFELENRTKPEETKAISGNVKVMRPEQVADALFKGLEKNKFLIIPGLDGRLTNLAKRFVPGLVDRIMAKAAAKVGAGK